MEILKTALQDVLIIEPKYHADDRGYFCETFKSNWFEENVRKTQFVQDNESYSTKNTFRGMHYQIPPYCQSKLVRVPQGAVIDFVADIRKDSPTFGKLIQVELSSENRKQLWIPRGCAHGFLVASETALFQYKVDNVYSREHERSFSIFDPQLKLDLPPTLSLSDKDKTAPSFSEAWMFETLKGLYDA